MDSFMCFDEDWESSSVRGTMEIVEFVQRWMVEMQMQMKMQVSVEGQLLEVSTELTEVLRDIGEFKEDMDGSQPETEEIARESAVSLRFKGVGKRYTGIIQEIERARIVVGERMRAQCVVLWKQIVEIGEDWMEYCGERSSLTDDDIGEVGVSYGGTVDD